MGEKVCVIGLGLIGQLVSQYAKLTGCFVVGVDINDERLSIAKNNNVDVCLNNITDNILHEIDNITDKYGVDCTIITTSSNNNNQIQHAMQLTRQKGRVVLIGNVDINFDREPLYSKEIDFLISCSTGPGRYDANYEKYGNDYPYAFVRWTEKRNMETCASFIKKKLLNINSLVSQECQIDNIESAYKKLKNKDALGIIISYDSQNKNIKDDDIILKNDICVNEKLETIKCLSTKKKCLNIACIGVGGFAKTKLLPLLKNFNNVKIHSVVDTKIQNAINISNLYSVNNIYSDYQKVLFDDNIDAVVIATHHKDHLQQSIDFMQAGKAVFIEKPCSNQPRTILQSERFS